MAEHCYALLHMLSVSFKPSMLIVDTLSVVMLNVVVQSVIQKFVLLHKKNFV
jgi:hypothetical protein